MVEPQKKSNLDNVEGIEHNIPNPFIRNVDSTMINQSKKWKDVIKEDNPILDGVIEHGFLKPSKIQAVAVPYIIAEPI